MQTTYREQQTQTGPHRKKGQVLAFRTAAEKVQADLAAKNYRIVEDQYDLSALFTDLIHRFPRLSTDSILKIEWSEEIEKGWYACHDLYDPTHIYVNQLFSSPEIDPEVIQFFLYFELLVLHGFSPSSRDFRRQIADFPNAVEMLVTVSSLTEEFGMEGLKAGTIGADIQEWDQLIGYFDCLEW